MTSSHDFKARAMSPSQMSITNYDLHQFIEMGCWSEVGEILLQDNIGDLTSVPYPHRDGDFPLHAICDFKFDNSNQVMNSSQKGKDSRNATVFPPPTNIVLGILKAFPNATKVKGSHGCLPLHK